MSAEYHLIIKDEQNGPYTLEQLRGMWASGAITLDTLYWTKGMADWQPMRNLISQLQPVKTTDTRPPSPYVPPVAVDPNKKMKEGCGGCLGLIIIAFVCSMLFDKCKGDSDTSSSSSRSAKVINSAWDGSVFQVERYLKRTLKDPDSYQGIEWSKVTTTKDGGYMVRHRYRAKNSFGGYVVEERIFMMDSQGDVTGTVP